MSAKSDIQMNQTRIVQNSQNAFNLIATLGNIIMKNSSLQASDIVITSGGKLNLTEVTTVNSLAG